MDALNDTRDQDVESGLKGTTHPTSRLELEITEAAGMFLVWSILAIVEGVVRGVSNSRPESGLTPSEGFPPLALLVAGQAEVVFGMLGIVLAIAVLAFKLRSATILLAFLIIQSVFGWFVFITYVIAFPAYTADHLVVGPNGLTANGFSRGLERFLIFLGILTSISWCAALQAGQFIMAARLMSMVKGKHETLKMHKLRATVWTAFAFLAGCAIFLSACIVLGKKDADTPFLPPPAFPPNVNIYPQILIATGLFTLLWAALGLAGAISSHPFLLSAFNTTWFVIFFINLVSFALVLGKIPGGALAGPAAQLTMLTFAYTFLPVVFTRKMLEWKEHVDHH